MDSTWDFPEQRILNSLILLAGITFLAVGVATGQLPKIIEILGKILEAATAG